MPPVIPIGLPWNSPLLARDRSAYAAPPYRLRRRPLVAPPPVEPPLTLAEVVLHLRLDPDAATGPEAPLLESMISAATRHLEDYASVTLQPTLWRMTLQHFPPILWGSQLDLPNPPFRELRAITIRDDPQDLDLYAVEDDERGPARLYPKSGIWPFVWSLTPAVIAIEWLAGPETPKDVAPPLRQAALMAIAHWYEQRESSSQWQLYPVIELGWDRLLSSYREPGFA